MLIRADSLLLPLRDDSIQAVVTSPPYFRQRGYGDHPAEGGEEQTLDLYVRWLVAVLADCRRVLRPDGLLWLNIGDKANGSGGGGGDWKADETSNSKGKRWGLERGPKGFYDPAYARQSFLDVPGAVVRALLDDGWRLRLPIVWDKAVEERADLRHLNRPRWSHEMIFLLSPGPGRARFFPSMLDETGSVWHFGIRRPGRPKLGSPHLAPFPDELARRCILPSTLPGDLVLDPFDGSGTTRRVAAELGRTGVGVDIYAGRDVIELTSAKPSTSRRPSPSTVDREIFDRLRQVEVDPDRNPRPEQASASGDHLDTLDHRDDDETLLETVAEALAASYRPTTFGTAAALIVELERLSFDVRRRRPGPHLATELAR